MVSFYLLNYYSLLNNGKNYRVKPNVCRLRYLTLQCLYNHSDKNILWLQWRWWKWWLSFLGRVLSILRNMIIILHALFLIHTLTLQGCYYSFRDHQTETQFKLLAPNHTICKQHGWVWVSVWLQNIDTSSSIENCFFPLGFIISFLKWNSFFFMNIFLWWHIQVAIFFLEISFSSFEQFRVSALSKYMFLLSKIFSNMKCSIF